jgi:high-affinity Fe2+/Pb2+ permease
MKDFFKTMFANNEGTSHKRVLGTLGFISLIVFLFICAETHKAEAIAAVEYLTIATVFGTVLEKFVPKSSNKTTEE